MFSDSQNIDNEQMLQLAIQTYRSGNRENAKMLLRQVHQRDRHNTSALLWLAKISRHPQERMHWLERLLEIDPEHETAQKTIKRIRYRRAAAENKVLLQLGSITAIMLIMTLIMWIFILVR